MIFFIYLMSDIWAWLQEAAILIDPHLWTKKVCETFVGTATHMSPERVMGEVGFFWGKRTVSDSLEKVMEIFQWPNWPGKWISRLKCIYHEQRMSIQVSLFLFLLVVGENLRNPTQQNLEGDRGSVWKCLVRSCKSKELENGSKFSGAFFGDHKMVI